MKLLVYIIFLLFLNLSAFSQTNTTLTNFNTTLSLKSSYEINSGALYNKSLKSGKFGCFLGIGSSVSSGVGLGLAGGYLNNRPLFASVNLKLGAKTHIPYAGDFSYYLASGPDFDFGNKSFGSYNFVGLSKVFYLNKKKSSELSIGYGLGNISTIPGITQLGSVNLTHHF